MLVWSANSLLCRWARDLPCPNRCSNELRRRGFSFVRTKQSLGASRIKLPPTRTDLAEAKVRRSRGSGPGMGIAAGGNIVQKIYPDPYGLDCWNSDETARAQIYIVNNSQFLSITGRTPSPPVISAAHYTRIGLPWFKLWDADMLM
jgi:hypothetical protein